MVKNFFIIFICFASSTQLLAQDVIQCAQSKIKAYQNIQNKTTASSSDNLYMERYDVHWYFLDLNIERNSTDVTGNVTMGVTFLQNTDTFCFELNNSLDIDSIVFNNNNLAFQHNTSNICYAFGTSFLANSNANIQIFYHGDASVVGGSAIGDGFSTATSPTWGNEVTWSLSQPYSAYEWFPCKQFLQDKADSAWVFVSTSSENKVGSNGILEGIDVLQNNRVRYRWKTHYPIDYYLISIAVAKYVDYTIYAHPAAMAGDSIPIVNYVYDNPLTLSTFKSVIDTTALLLEYFSDVFGLYAFSDEKYGHSMAPFSGGMEHQTMTSQGTFNFALIAHELGHQWFGDKVTCSTWKDIFVNEGFATYLAYLAYEHFRPASQATQRMYDAHQHVKKEMGGSIYFTDTANVGRVFDSRLSYNKGCVILHTLRFVLGSHDFFDGCKNYLITHNFETAGIADFKSAMSNTSGKNLDTFFNQWIYGEGFPVWDAKYFSDGNHIFLHIKHQSTTSTIPTFYTPLEIKCLSLAGDTTIKVMINSNDEYYKIPINRLSYNIDIDPNNWVLDSIANLSLDPNLIFLANENFTIQKQIQIYPSPSNGDLNFSFENMQIKIICIYDISGNEIKKESIIGTNKIHWNLNELSSGIYFIKIEDGFGEQQYFKWVKN